MHFICGENYLKRSFDSTRMEYDGTLKGDCCYNDRNVNVNFFFLATNLLEFLSLLIIEKDREKMTEPAESLLKYDTPVSNSKGPVRKTVKVRPYKVSPKQPVDSPVPPPPKAKSGSPENEDVLTVIFPPREWAEGNQLWVQRVSSAPCTRADVVNLEEVLDRKLQQRRALETGICPVRRELYSQCFDELIRQVTINCGERGLLLMRVRDEIQMSITAYQTLYESSVVFGMRKALQAEQDKMEMRQRISNLETEKQDLTKHLNELKAECIANEKRNEEKWKDQEKKHTEQIQFLKRTNQQLKVEHVLWLVHKDFSNIFANFVHYNNINTEHHNQKQDHCGGDVYFYLQTRFFFLSQVAS
ncbi:axonemal dynein light intermediate polypeptide 1-like [Syngnathoides biaculeatus]|uniref:axonemal dynein light intermediate polypeptide 1-like n=1 Tax=Syngnathoides biaculeatus TaxID=300417 RepID=UPI002ADE4FEB|nr:axonemal dynein light intermediate polypeptide 1-like [Syngnathoides biaculeatus]